jgi:hypothetical protein
VAVAGYRGGASGGGVSIWLDFSWSMDGYSSQKVTT